MSSYRIALRIPAFLLLGCGQAAVDYAELEPIEQGQAAPRRVSCADDSDCASTAYCHPTVLECIPYSVEGEPCGGYTYPPGVWKCAEGLVCADSNPMISDLPGTCRRDCETAADCNAGEYCSHDGICRAPCSADDECPELQFCNAAIAECLPLSLEGEACGGRTNPPGALQCAPWLVCDPPSSPDDRPGVCRSTCTSDTGCPAPQTCGADGVCHDGATCEYDGTTYAEGDSFSASDGCNTCFCTDTGAVSCTRMYCPACEYDGAMYLTGDSFPASDGCNTCSCGDGGTVACTKIYCLPPRPNAGRFEVRRELPPLLP